MPASAASAAELPAGRSDPGRCRGRQSLGDVEGARAGWRLAGRVPPGLEDPWGPPAADEWTWEEVAGRLHRGRPLFRSARARGAVWLVAPGTALVYGRPSPGDPAWAELLLAASLELAAGRGELPLHAGAVELEGRGCLMVGASGAGKSTLAVLATLAGACFVADDLVLVDRRGGWRATALGRGAWLDPRICEELGAALGQAVDTAPRQDGADSGRHSFEGGCERQGASCKEWVDPLRARTLEGTPVVGRRVIGVDLLVQLVAPAAGTRPLVTSWRPLTSGAALAAILGQVALALDGDAATRQLAVLDELARLPVVRLQPGRDLVADPRRVREILDGVLRRVGSGGNRECAGPE